VRGDLDFSGDIDNVSCVRLTGHYQMWDTDWDIGNGTDVTVIDMLNEHLEMGDGYDFPVIKDNSIRNVGEMSGSYGINGSTISAGPDAACTVIAAGDADAEDNWYAGRMVCRTNIVIKYLDGIVRFGNADIGYTLSTGAARYFEFDSDVVTLEIMDLRVTQAQYIQAEVTPDYCHNLRLHNVTNGLNANASNLVWENVIFSGTYTYDAYLTSGDTNLTLHNPSKPLDSIINTTAGTYSNERYPLDIHTTDSDGDDLNSVNVICDRANIVTGSDSNVYRCTASVSYTVDATHKPITGSDYASFFEQVTDSGVTGGDWRTGSFYMSDERVFGNVSTGNKGIKLDQSDTQYIDLNTSAGYLNGLKDDEFAIISTFKPSSDNAANVRIISSENPVSPIFYDNSDFFRFSWSAANGAIHDIKGTAKDVLLNDTIVFDGTNIYGSFNGTTITSDTYTDDGLATPDANKIRLGAAADNAADPAKATFGPFFILDLRSVTTVDTTFAQKLANAVHVAAKENDYSAESIRAAIMAVDANIVGILGLERHERFNGVQG
jgi:hypothetical protein